MTRPHRVHFNKVLQLWILAVALTATIAFILLAWPWAGEPPRIGNFVIAVFVAAVLHIAVLLARFAIVGRADAQVPRSVRRLHQFWVVIKLGLLGALIAMLVGLGVSFIAGFDVGVWGRAIMLILFSTVIGSLIVHAVANVAIIRGRSTRAPDI